MAGTVTGIELLPITSEERLAKPWKYIGYRDFVRFAASDDDFITLRRFDELHTRILLSLQDNLSELEAQLKEIDDRLSRRDAPDTDNGCIRKDQAERLNLIASIHKKIDQYDKTLCRYIQLKGRPTVHKTNVRNIKTWLSNRNEPIHPSEVEFVNAGDLISLAKVERASLRRLFEQRILAPSKGLFGLLRNRTRENDLKTTVQGHEGPVSAIGTVTIFVAAIVMLIAPLWALALMGERIVKLVVITVFIVVFLAMLNWGTVSTQFEILAATAG
ncbi:hypothetical protein B0H63DRAFT_305759 [Podospora didyma]|uniref:DUF6594 domain-containing protein n=1 Tax=Podospora didyma TaxID=330526 RepID=A0AAE0K4L4_9PEZI|nr:hypothetical protein B0H63DRAFT_305759 [Podospora didyma]